MQSKLPTKKENNTLRARHEENDHGCVFRICWPTMFAEKYREINRQQPIDGNQNLSVDCEIPQKIHRLSQLSVSHRIRLVDIA